MVFRDAQINYSVADHREKGTGLDHRIGMEDEAEFLLVDGGRSQAGCLDSCEKPRWNRLGGLVEVLERLQRMLHALRGTIT